MHSWTGASEDEDDKPAAKSVPKTDSHKSSHDKPSAPAKPDASEDIIESTPALPPASTPAQRPEKPATGGDSDASPGLSPSEVQGMAPSNWSAVGTPLPPLTPSDGTQNQP